VKPLAEPSYFFYVHDRFFTLVAHVNCTSFCLCFVRVLLLADDSHLLNIASSVFLVQRFLHILVAFDLLPVEYNAIHCLFAIATFDLFISDDDGDTFRRAILPSGVTVGVLERQQFMEDDNGVIWLVGTRFLIFRDKADFLRKCEY